MSPDRVAAVCRWASSSVSCITLAFLRDALSLLDRLSVYVRQTDSRSVKALYVSGGAVMDRPGADDAQHAGDQLGAADESPAPGQAGAAERPNRNVARGEATRVQLITIA